MSNSTEKKGNWFQELISNPRVKYGGYASVITAVVVVAVIIVNILVTQLGWQIDMTENDVFTLSDQSQSVLDALDEDVTISVLARRNQEPQQVMEALDRYAQASSRIRIETVDAETNPGFVAEYDPEGEGLGNGSLIVATERNYRTIDVFDLYSIDNRNPQAPVVLGLNVERRVTNALLYLVTGQTPIIYQTSGRGEPDISSAIPQLAQDLDTENYEIRTINLIQAPQVPEDGSVLLMVGPRSDVSEGEAQKIKDFLERGGRAVFVVGLLLEELPNLSDLLSGYGIGIPQGVIIEGSAANRTENPFQLVPALNPHPVSDSLIEARRPVVMPFGRPIELLDTKPRGVTLEPIAATSEESYLRTDLQNQDPARVAGDALGPYNVAVGAIDRDFSSNEEVSRIMVIGSVEMLNPLYYGFVPGNRDFMLNAIGWVQNQTELSIRAKTTLQLPMQLTGAQILIFAGLFVVIIPLGVLITGLVVWLRRRHL